MLSTEESEDAVTVLDAAYEHFNSLKMDTEEPSYLEALRATTALKQRVHSSLHAVPDTLKSAAHRPRLLYPFKH